MLRFANHFLKETGIMSVKVLTEKVRDGLALIDMEMTATVDTMPDRPHEAEEIRAALDWIDYQVSRCDRKRAFAIRETKT